MNETSIAIIRLLAVAHEHDMKASTEETCQNEITRAALVGISERNTVDVDELTV